MALRVLLKTPLNSSTGYGRDGMGLAKALQAMGCDVRLMPVNCTPPLDPEVAEMLTRPIEAPVDLLIHHVDPAQVGLTSGERRAAHRTLLWTMWEFTGIGDQPWEPELTTKLSAYDQIYVYDQVSRQALQPHTGTPINVLQGGYDAEPWRINPRERDWSGTIRYCMAGALNQRKNPFAAIRAFEKVHEEYPDTELHLKTVERSLHPQIEERYPGVKIHYGTWSQRQMLDLYRSCHAYVAPSWGEGKNLPAIEAATTGQLAIVSDFGGHREWADPEWAIRVPGTTEEHLPGMGSFRVNEDALLDAMEAVVFGPSKARQMGELAARTLPSLLSWDRAVRNLLGR
jgi:glycosyltransferase involved in cell wall biosynthesis